ncbi:hypothetical protein [[Clostridium] polysaccharolyticum]|uniref:Uncharacterized protein n=1 Tax=[Clostridium] polysaccharolyticum TaxID=29364 RepID=A0A1H9YRF1_9FIRM|nr:hypothetical protein [[Clostridium] polysaccharolyticum]SES71075.1 hypothetical protein SAMN04487772_102137 [[Clostridium] polysaccharolyticum]
MTGQEFIASLSPVAHRIMSIYQFKEEKPIALHITDNTEKPCFMVNDDPNCYPLYINPDALGPMAEKAFIHQFCHCVQIEEQFPFVRSKTPDDPQTVQLAHAINSLVLDMFVNHVLNDNGYPKDVKKLEALYTELHFRFRYFTEKKLPITADNQVYAEYIYATQIARVYMELDSKRARALQKEVAVFSKETKLYAGIFINTIKAYPYDTHVGCHYIFDHLVDQLKLSDVLEIGHIKKPADEAAATEEVNAPDNVMPLNNSDSEE